MAWKLQWHNRKEVDLVDIMLSNVTTASTGTRTKLTEERGSNPRCWVESSFTL